MKLPADGETKLSRAVVQGHDENGGNIWGNVSRVVPNTELKALMESYKDKSRGSVRSDLDGRRTEAAQTPRTVGDRPGRPENEAR